MSEGAMAKTEDLVDQLVQRRPGLLRQATRMLRNGNEAEDAAQDAMVAALTHLDRFRGDSQLSTWLYRVGANAVLMNMRHNKRMNDRTQRAAQQVPVESVGWLYGSSHFMLPQAQVEGAEQIQLLHWALDHLPNRYREVVVRCDLNEQPMDEVAESLGITVGGVRTRRLRAHRMLKSVMLHQEAPRKNV